MTTDNSERYPTIFAKQTFPYTISLLIRNLRNLWKKVHIIIELKKKQRDWYKTHKSGYARRVFFFFSKQHRRYKNGLSNKAEVAWDAAKWSWYQKDYLIVCLTRARGACWGSMMMVDMVVVVMVKMFLLGASHPTLSAPRPAAALATTTGKLVKIRAGKQSRLKARRFTTFSRRFAERKTFVTHTEK